MITSAMIKNMSCEELEELCIKHGIDYRAHRLMKGVPRFDAMAQLLVVMRNEGLQERQQQICDRCGRKTYHKYGTCHACTKDVKDWTMLVRSLRKEEKEENYKEALYLIKQWGEWVDAGVVWEERKYLVRVIPVTLHAIFGRLCRRF